MMSLKINNRIRRQIMQSAWYIKRYMGAKSFAAALRQAWLNLQQKVLYMALSGIDPNEIMNREVKPTRSEPVAVPAGYYGVAGRYYGD